MKNKAQTRVSSARAMVTTIGGIFSIGAILSPIGWWEDGGQRLFLATPKPNPSRLPIGWMGANKESRDSLLSCDFTEGGDSSDRYSLQSMCGVQTRRTPLTKMMRAFRHFTRSLLSPKYVNDRFRSNRAQQRP